jgi:hypothetical protein
VLTSEPPKTPLEALGKASIHLSSVSEGADPNTFWLWIVADNLRLVAENAAQLIPTATFVWE